MRYPAICALSLATLVCNPVAGGESRVQPVEVTVAIPADASAEEIHSLLVRQAREACRTRSVYPHTHMDEERRCRSEFVADAVATIDDDSLTAVHREDTETELSPTGDTVALDSGR